MRSHRCQSPWASFRRSRTFCIELHLRNNRLHELSDSIGALTELRQLDLRGNPLVSLPEALIALPKLDKLDLRWTPSLPLPAWIDRLEARGCLVYR